MSDMHIKAPMRRGVWLHLVRAYPDTLETQEQREMYIGNLRRVYDSLKGQWHVDDGEQQYRHLCESVKRDALRTDPQESFFRSGAGVPSDEDNVQRLVNILAIYILEHSGVKYTQGMTDLLSPILYVMQREDDAYICFCAMLERIKENFGTWCEGTLNKIERLKHLCRVLDPQLYSHLAHSVEEDAFALFFGMVLIECRREFSFNDSFHLLEVIWAATLYLEMEEEDGRGVDDRHREGQGERGDSGEDEREGVNRKSRTPSQWAGYMTYESTEVVQQVFGETPCPYSARPLTRTTSGNYSTGYSSRHASVASGGQFSSTQIVEIMRKEEGSPFEEIEGEEEEDGGECNVSDDETAPVDKGSGSFYSDPNAGSTIGSPQDVTETVAQIETNEPSLHLESESHNGETVDAPDKPTVQRHPTEMSDMSSVSSGTNNANGLLSSCKLSDTPDSSHSREGSSRSIDSAGLVMHGGGMLSDHSFYTPQELSSSSQHSEGAIVAKDGKRAPMQSDGGNGMTHGSSSPLSLLDKPTQARPGSLMSPSTGTGNSTFPSHQPRRVSTPRPLSPLDARLSPVAFFDRFEQLASSIRSRQQQQRAAMCRNLQHRSRNNSEISQTLSLILSTEQSAPQVTREHSLQVPPSSSFSLCVCLAILVQNRKRIMEERLDFVGLSVLLNAQAGAQNLGRTLRIAQRLFVAYQHYQLMYFGPGVKGQNQWLDADGGRHDNVDSNN